MREGERETTMSVFDARCVPFAQTCACEAERQT